MCSELRAYILNPTAPIRMDTTPIITEFDRKRTTKTGAFIKRAHKRPNGVVGISTWKLRMNDATPKFNAKASAFMAEILADIVPHEFGANPYREGCEAHYDWELAHNSTEEDYD